MSSPRWSLVDAIIEIFIPIAIMGLLWSLLFFMIDVGIMFNLRTNVRTAWVLFWFVMAAVLINRIRFQLGEGSGMLYSLVLAGATALVVLKYSLGGNPLFPLALMAFIWWVADRLTRECCGDRRGIPTMDQGLVRSLRKRRIVEKVSRESVAEDGKEGSKSLPQKHQGISAVYFSLLALLIFGIGQQFIDPGNVAAQSREFSFMLTFTFMVLIILLLTSLSGFRRFLKEKRVSIPASIGFFWLTIGIVCVVGVMFLTNFIPLPYSRQSRSITGLSYLRQGGVQRELRSDKITLKLLPGSGRGSTSRKQGNKKGISPGKKMSRWLIAKTRLKREETRQQAVRKGRASKILNIGREVNPVSRLGKAAIMAVLVTAGVIVTIQLINLLTNIGSKRSKIARFLSGTLKRLSRLFSFIRVPRIRIRKRQKVIRKPKGECLSARFDNPFRKQGPARNLSLAQKVSYSYQALMAFAEDIGCGKEEDKTPLEYLHDLPEPMFGLRKEIGELTQLLVESQYANIEPGEDSLKTLRRFWNRLERNKRKVLI